MTLALIVAALLAQASPSAAPAVPAPPAANPVPTDAAVMARAKDWLHQVQAGKIDRSQLTDKMNSLITDSTLAQVSAQLASLGEPRSFTLAQKTTQGALTAYVYKLRYSRA